MMMMMLTTHPVVTVSPAAAGHDRRGARGCNSWWRLLMKLPLPAPCHRQMVWRLPPPLPPPQRLPQLRQPRGYLPASDFPLSCKPRHHCRSLRVHITWCKFPHTASCLLHFFKKLAGECVCVWKKEITEQKSVEKEAFLYEMLLLISTPIEIFKRTEEHLLKEDNE